jgi:hypothetical protein
MGNKKTRLTIASLVFYFRYFYLKINYIPFLVAVVEAPASADGVAVVSVALAVLAFLALVALGAASSVAVLAVLAAVVAVVSVALAVLAFLAFLVALGAAASVAVLAVLAAVVAALVSVAAVVFAAKAKETGATANKVAIITNFFIIIKTLKNFNRYHKKIYFIAAKMCPDRPNHKPD